MLRSFNTSQVNAGMHLAFLLKISGHQAAALQVYRELHDLPNMTLHANFVECTAEWALLLEATGEIHEAERVLKMELQQSREIRGDVDPATLQLSSCLARFLQRKGSMQALEEAEQLHRKTWETKRVVMESNIPRHFNAVPALRSCFERKDASRKLWSCMASCCGKRQKSLVPVIPTPFVPATTWHACFKRWDAGRKQNKSSAGR